MAKGVSRLTVEDLEAGRLNAVQRARIRRTRRFFEDREAFMRDLALDIAKAIKLAEKEGLTPVFRLNGTSDIRWETVRPATYAGKTIFEMFPEQVFYDYTKLPNRRNLPANYHLTFSLADGNDEQAQAALSAGMPVAVVFRDKATVQRYIEAGFMGAKVVDGDETDLRFLDPRGVVVALYAKGNAKRDTSGFVRD